MIDRATVERIKDTADIVDVVSEFVTLRKSGANYKGLCPFHNEKTPSFIVSPVRGTCHCFGCGKGGNAVSFIMEHEQLTYPEALRWLAKKYNIEIKERELTDQEREMQNERESMFIVNEWASNYFTDILHNNVDGQAFGMQYFRSRGFRDDTIEKFHLGYSLADRLALSREALGKGYKEQYILSTGLCYKNDRDELVNRYAGRVIFPWIGLSGKVVGFGGRLLDQRTKGVNQKYVNSPDSDIFHKDHELYGIYQAKKAIAREDHVYMVEGYTDVISMHQCGIENVVANSGTALSVHQIHMLHRFTSNITLLYDGDSAGIHAAMRGTDMLLSEGMNLRVLLLPDGDDPDSFARKHSASEFKEYVEKNQTDFIHFKAELMLHGVTDPAKRSEAINSIIGSIALVKDPVLRDTYVRDCSSHIGIAETTLINTMNRIIRESQGKGSYGAMSGQTSTATSQPSTEVKNDDVQTLIIKNVLKYGERIILRGELDENGASHDYTVAEYVSQNLAADGLSLGNELYDRMLSDAAAHSHDEGFSAEPYFINHHDIEMGKLASSLSVDTHQLYESEQTEGGDNSLDEETLLKHIDHLLTDFRLSYLENKLSSLKREIAQSAADQQRLTALMQQYAQLQTLRNELARRVGKRI